MNIPVEQSAKSGTTESRAARITVAPALCALALASALFAACSDAPDTAAAPVAQAAQPSAHIEPAKFTGKAGIAADRPAADATRPVVYAGQPATPVFPAGTDAAVERESGTIPVMERELGTASDGGYFAYPER